MTGGINSRVSTETTDKEKFKKFFRPGGNLLKLRLTKSEAIQGNLQKAGKFKPF